MGTAVIVAAVRTPVGKRGGALAGLHAAEILGGALAGELVPPGPALLISTSIRPKCPAAPSTSAATCSSSVTSQGWDQTRPA